MLPDEMAVAKLVLEVAMPDVLTPVSWFEFFDGYRNWFFYSRIVGISWMYSVVLEFECDFLFHTEWVGA